MLRINLLTEPEKELYEYIWQAFLQAIKPFFMLQLAAFVFCTALFFDTFTSSQVLLYWLWILAFSGTVVMHVQYIKQHKIWSELKAAWRLSLVVLLYLTLGYATWGWLILHLLAVNSTNVIVAIVIATACGAFAISAFAGFQRVFMVGMLIAAIRLCLELYVLYGYAAYPYILSIIGVGVFQYILLRIQNKKMLDTLSLKSQNVEMVDTLRLKNEQLGQANLSQSRYLSAASHDLRQSLHALALIADDVRRKNDNAVIDLPLKQIEHAIDSLSKSFDAMLNLSRLDAGVIQPKVQAVSMQRLLDRLTVEFEAVALDKGLRFVVVPTDIWVEADEGVLYSILTNFVSNSIRYTEHGGILIGVRRRGQLAMPVVYDTGIGIPHDKLNEIFGEYQQLDYSQQRVIGGVGLGLAISERMAALLNARFVVRSELNRGSSFGVCLPQAKGERPVTVVDLNAYNADALLDKKVVILDDDEIAVEKLDDLFRSWGMDVSVVLSSEMLQELIDDEGEVDLVVSDYHLGLARENGLDVLQFAQKIQPERPPHCLLITGDTTMDLIEAAKQKSIDVLHKPISPARLRAFLNGLLRPQDG